MLIRHTFLMLGVAGFALSVAPASTAARGNQSAPECRTSPLPDGTPAMFCKDKKGNWKQQEGKVETRPVAAPASAPAAPLKAEVKYQGTYEFVFKAPPPRRPRRQGLGDLISGAISGATDANTIREPGGITMTLTFDGPSVTATLSGSTIVYKKLVGLVQNGNCVLTNPGGEGHGTVRYEGPCGPNGFSGKVSGITNRNQSYTGTFQMIALSYTDISARDARRTELEAKCDGGSGSQVACLELKQLN